MSSRASRTLYVGNVPGDIREREVADLFYKYGRIVHIDLKIPPRPPGHCFIEFEDARDAEDAIRDAIRGRDGYNFDGNRLRVELARGGRGQSSTNNGDSSRASQTLCVGNLPGDIRKREVEDLFYKYGRIVDVDLKIPPGPPGHCFIKFEDAPDAEDAIRDRDGYNFDVNRLRVELARGGRGQSSTNDGDISYGGTDTPSSSLTPSPPRQGSSVGSSLTPSPPRQGSSVGSSLTPSPPRQGSSSTVESAPNGYDESVPVNPDDGSVPVNVPVNPDDGSVPVNPSIQV